MTHTTHFILCALLVIISLSSCQKDSQQEPMTVHLSVDVNGNLSNSPTVTYYDAQGQLQTESLTTDWSKTFQANYGAELLLNAKGTIDGTITIKAKASVNDEPHFEGEYDATSLSAPSNFDIKIEETLEDF